MRNKREADMKTQGGSNTLLAVFFSFIAIAVIVGPVNAQKQALTKEDIPQAVIVAIQTDFPAWDINKTQWFGYNRETGKWAPVEDGMMHYVVEAKGKNYETRAVYNKKGKLRYSKTVFKNVRLPKAIQDRLASQEYAGWTLTGNQEVIKNFKEDKKYFKVYLQKDGKKKTVYFNRVGELTKRFPIGG